MTSGVGRASAAARVTGATVRVNGMEKGRPFHSLWSQKRPAASEEHGRIGAAAAAADAVRQVGRQRQQNQDRRENERRCRYLRSPPPRADEGSARPAYAPSPQLCA